MPVSPMCSRGGRKTFLTTGAAASAAKAGSGSKTTRIARWNFLFMTAMSVVEWGAKGAYASEDYNRYRLSGQSAGEAIPREGQRLEIHPGPAHTAH